MVPAPSTASPLAPSRASQLAGLGASAGVVSIAVLMGGMGFGPYIDLPSAFIVGTGTGGLLLATFGVKGSAHALATVLGRGGTEPQLAHATAWCVAAGVYALGTGIVGVVIGLVQMLQNMSHPTQIGPASAMALLCLLYGMGGALLAFAGALSVARREPTGVAVEGTAAVTAAAVGVGAAAGAAGLGLILTTLMLVMVV